MSELLPEHVAKVAIDAYRAAGYQVSEHYAGGGRFHRYDVKAPTGETFVIQVEEIW